MQQLISQANLFNEFLTSEQREKDVCCSQRRRIVSEGRAGSRPFFRAKDATHEAQSA